MVVIEVNVLVAGNSSSMAVIQKSLDAIAKDALKFVYKSLSNEKAVGLGHYQIGFILVDNKNAKTHIMEITGEILRVCDFVVVVGINQEDVIIKLIEDGAFECLRSPIEQSALLSCLWRLIRIVRLHANNNILKDRCIDSNIRLVGSSHSIRYLKAIIEKTANSSSRVMITGASGAGKKLVARLIHKSSCSKQGEFVVCRSADYKSENFCCKTFNVDYPGNIFRKTEGGVLYIEECTLLPLEAQAQLLNFIHNDQFGSDRNNGQKPRIIASSSMDIEEALSKGLLREDLYYRLRVIPIRVPPLVERVEDFAELCQHFVDHFSKIEDLPHKELDPTVIAMMQTYHWPYNVSQLKNIVEWLLISTKNNPNSTIGPEAFSPSANIDIINTMPDVVSMSIKDAREAFEKKYLQAQISRFGGNISKTARFVRMERSALHRKLKALNMCN